MSFLPVGKYVVGLAFFGFIYWLLDGIMEAFIGESIHTAGTTFNLMHAMWTGSLLVYLVFGGWWVIRTYNEKNQFGGM